MLCVGGEEGREWEGEREKEKGERGEGGGESIHGGHNNGPLMMRCWEGYMVL